MIDALIVAGGSGSRMKAPLKKQYLQLGGRPLLSYTLTAFDRFPDLERITLVVPEADFHYCQTSIVAPLSLDHDIQMVAGGRRRQDSVMNGLDRLDSQSGTVMIHDGVRPFVRSSLLERCLAGVRSTGACIPVIPATDTLKRVDANVIVETLARDTIRFAQTPQTFSIDLIRRAHQAAARHSFIATDDASVAEFAGASVVVVPGDPDNIKITTPHDLLLAHTILDGWVPEADHTLG